MKTVVTLVSLLVLGWSETLQGAPELLDPLDTPQEMFAQNKPHSRLTRDVAKALEAEGSGDDQPLFDAVEACVKAPDMGPCFGIHHKYFYNSTSMSCEVFKFGGCLGNQNNFQTERECLQRCRTEAACRLPMLATPCTGQPVTWAFDSSVGMCVPYKKGFCQTNANKFYSKAECDEYCGTMGAV